MITAILCTLYLGVLFAILVRHYETIEEVGQWSVIIPAAIAWPIILVASYLMFAMPTILAYIKIGNKLKKG